MKNYWKSQWCNILLSLIHIGLSLWNFCRGDMIFGVAWLLSAVTWLIMTRVNHNEERITRLESEVEQLKNRAITDVIETGPNAYTWVRRLASDKEVK